MPPRATKKQNSSGSNVHTEPSVSLSQNGSSEVDYATLSISQLFKAALDRNSDPQMEKILRALIDKLPMETTEKIEEEKRSRSIVISGLKECSPNTRPSQRQKDLEGKVTEILDALDMECRPVEVRRMGRLDPSRPRLVKVVFSTRQEWTHALAHAHLLRSSGFDDVYIRRSMTVDERKQEYELRQIARERNKTSVLRVPSPNQGCADVLCLDIKFPLMTRLILIYRPPNSQKSDDENLLAQIEYLCSTSSQIIALGDFNMDLLQFTDASHSQLPSLFRFFNELNLVQNVNTPTRNGAILDLVFSPAETIQNVISLPPFSSSDHNIVSFSIMTEHFQIQALPMPDYINTDFVALNAHLRTIDCDYDSIIPIGSGSDKLEYDPRWWFEKVSGTTAKTKN
ncbi:hypothetical protein Y032_0317g2330 [Ancylostoma ceylanicum]|uniref:Endonuclease/exonuclease/phosphatase domain-containing protein n=1 Tax=Ancylostoma ceylanicum TaxID=53326 RepID=A0A016S184_9BILA|nr:hypothetical protein Y032_0317g2330 [Ancylostoma ceylanicum]